MTTIKIAQKFIEETKEGQLFKNNCLRLIANGEIFRTNESREILYAIVAYILSISFPVLKKIEDNKYSLEYEEIPVPVNITGTKEDFSKLIDCINNRFQEFSINENISIKMKDNYIKIYSNNAPKHELKIRNHIRINKSLINDFTNNLKEQIEKI